MGAWAGIISGSSDFKSSCSAIFMVVVICTLLVDNQFN